ncbi:MAG: ABC transporter ATP-binding protein [Candidatus Delongbacteria bacterium]|jgi:ABC-2 type transport system ATP-binding protein|nr:ABC transporter ATP-binding protein [Candidatus Delongbacteria bacterium]
MNKILDIQNVSKDFEGFKLDNINFSLDKGYIMGFIGPNGAGKTTTIRLIMNLLKKNSGDIKIFGMDNVSDEVAIKDRIGFVYEESYFYEHLTVKKMKEIIAPFYSRWDDEKFNEYCDIFGLLPKKKIKDLSKGTKMKFSLAVALSHNAELLILDEPTSGLDPVFRDKLMDILREEIQDENKSILFSTHITSDLEKIADYITFINNGKIVFTDQKDILLENYKIIKGDTNILSAEIKNELLGIKENKFGFEALCNVEKQSIFSQFEVVTEKPSLEQMMVYLSS